MTRDEKIVDLSDDLKQFLKAEAHVEYTMKACIRGGVCQVLLNRSSLILDDTDTHEIIPKKMSETDLDPYLLEFSSDGHLLKHQKVRLASVSSYYHHEELLQNGRGDLLYVSSFDPDEHQDKDSDEEEKNGEDNKDSDDEEFKKKKAAEKAKNKNDMPKLPIYRPAREFKASKTDVKKKDTDEDDKEEEIKKEKVEEYVHMVRF